jgi:uncharacterized RDD family membrane protein YckC
MSDNIYAAPESEIIAEETGATQEVASRSQRLLASFADGMLVGLILVTLVILLSVFDPVVAITQESPILSQVILVLSSLVVYFLLNGKLLITNGQTLGKRSAKIKIVDLNGQLPAVKKHLIKRYSVSMLIQCIPVIGAVLALINFLMIFGKQKRCGHDLFAGTKVVKCQSGN